MVEEWLLEAIEQKTGMSRETISSKIKTKLSEFPSLSEDAAVKMLATENGVMPIRRNFKVKDISLEIKHINISGKIKRCFPAREIKIKGASSKIMNLIISDDTGDINVVIWDAEKINQLSSAKNGDEIVIVNGYSKKNRLNESYEINISKNSAIKTTHVDSEAVVPVTRTYNSIKDVSENGVYTITCFITRLFVNGSPFIIRCRLCNKKVTEKCELHGEKAIYKTLMVSGIVDDGSSSIRASFFDKNAEKLLSMSSKENVEAKLNDISFGMFQIEIDAVPNRYNDLLSLNVKDVRKVDYNLAS